ncbi:GCN5 family acetyltransferase [Terrabacter sp. Soil811]|uniref:GNAT family N-acetyltransferase n=1 Tax=Terrabacter sp. Soil811 TaxID=1736419 RepID=UPI0006FA5003|nr:GNAT family N-acetyltransferase [Terrabacter sp. Soil811]KRF48209.1 GCN5 family acetyltransferase [Terrabacter sp. Soil811]
MSRSSSTFTLVTDAAEAQARFAGLVAREPEALSVVASVTDGLVVDRSRYVGARWWAATDASGEVVGAFMHTPPHPLHIALASADEARDLAALLADQCDVLPGVGGQRRPAEAFATEWVARTGATSRVAMEVGRFDLPTPPHVPFEVSGSFRLATDADTALVDGWHQQFVDAIEGEGRVVPSLDRHVTDGRVGLWEDAGRTVSMAYASPASGGVTRISGVWTPPELRGHGYASGVVAALSSARLDAGEACMLYTDLANPTSNAIYTAMGYRRVGDSISIAFGEQA